MAAAPKPPPFVLPIIDSAARAEGVEPALLRAMAFAESAYNPAAVSAKGAQGLMQIMPATARELGVTDPFDPRQSAKAAAKYIKRLLSRYGGDVAHALAAYNWGMGNVSAALEKGASFPRETQQYIARVLERATLERRALGGGADNPTVAATAAQASSTTDSQSLLVRCAHCGSTFAAVDADTARALAAQLIEQARALDSKKGPNT